MITAFALTIVGIGLAIGCWTAVQAYLRRPANAAQLVASITLEAAALVQSAILWIRLPHTPVVEPVTLIAYSIGILAPIPLGIYLARLERTRSGCIALGFTTVVVAVMTLRLQQIWGSHG
ncbi:MAG: hypothetical protein M3Z00_00250 [Actinomycetota bacterium]|nr:hypothetical protein [Actinomycetota bacterium]